MDIEQRYRRIQMAGAALAVIGAPLSICVGDNPPAVTAQPEPSDFTRRLNRARETERRRRQMERRAAKVGV